jgi:DNA-binding XRE family transcriptional regulator
MPIRSARSLRAIAVRERSEAADAADLAARSLASIEAEISSVRKETIDLAAPDLAPSSAGSPAALLEAAALDRAARRERSRELADRLATLESDRDDARRDLDLAKEALAKAIRKVERLSTLGS